MGEEDRGIVKMTRGQAAGFLVVVVLVTALLTFGFASAYLLEEAGEGPSPDVLTNAENYDELVRTMQLILEDFVDEADITVEGLIEGAIQGAISSIDDPYSMYFDASALRDFQRETVEGEYSGIGASILDIEGYVTIMVPFEGTPAATTPFKGSDPDDPVGLRPGDRIIRVDGVNVVGMSADFVAEMIRGPVGEEVVVEVERPRERGSTDLTFEIERDTIEIPTVTSRVIDDVGVMTINRFTSHTPEQVSYHLEQLSGVGGIIIDLRNNPGGTLDDCIEVTDMFVPPGPAMRIVDRDGESEVIEVSGPGFEDPLVVLINGFTASAGEILAGALRDRMGVPLVGETTFGKGSVQRLYYLDRDKPSGMKLTTERYLTASGYSIEEEGGLKPDHEVAWPEDGVWDDPEEDPQLRRALEILREQMEGGT